jgi:hypothetical protein
MPACKTPHRSLQYVLNNNLALLMHTHACMGQTWRVGGMFSAPASAVGSFSSLPGLSPLHPHASPRLRAGGGASEQQQEDGARQRRRAGYGSVAIAGRPVSHLAGTCVPFPFLSFTCGGRTYWGWRQRLLRGWTARNDLSRQGQS